jgi:hypothetical protein
MPFKKTKTMTFYGIYPEKIKTMLADFIPEQVNYLRCDITCE